MVAGISQQGSVLCLEKEGRTEIFMDSHMGNLHCLGLEGDKGNFV